MRAAAAILVCLLAVLSGISPARAESLQSLETFPAETVADRFVSNPRSVKDIGDPFVLEEDGTYYVFATGGPIGFNVWKSTDLATFEKSKALQKVSWASGDYWAPEVFHIGDRYVMLFTARARETQSLRTGIAFAEKPEGPYTDPLGHPLMELGYATIDATLCFDTDGQPYLIYVRDCSENEIGSLHVSQIYGAPLAPDLLSLAGDPVLLTTPEGSWETRSGDWQWNEGPAVVFHDGRYYLYYSVNAYWMSEYSVDVAVSDHVLGPYEKQDPCPLLGPVYENGTLTVSGPGHNSFVTIGDELFTAYHTHTYLQNPSGNRQLCLDRAGFHTDGTAFLSGPTLAPQLRPLKELGLVSHLPLAACTGDPDRKLSDGDLCIADPAYGLQDPDTAWTFDAPVTADMILIHPLPGESFSGRIILNDTWCLDISVEASSTPGAGLILPFEAREITSLRLSGTGSLAEVMLIGTP